MVSRRDRNFGGWFVVSAGRRTKTTTQTETQKENKVSHASLAAAPAAALWTLSVFVFGRHGEGSFSGGFYVILRVRVGLSLFRSLLAGNTNHLSTTLSSREQRSAGTTNGHFVSVSLIGRQITK